HGGKLYLWISWRFRACSQLSDLYERGTAPIRGELPIGIRMRATESGSLTRLGTGAADPAILPLLETLLRAIADYSGAIAAAVRLRDPGREELRLVATVGIPATMWRHKRRVDINCGSCGAALAHNEARLESIHCACSEELAHASNSGDLNLLTIPLRDAQEPCGVLNLFFPPAVAIPEQLPALLTAFSELIGLTLANSRRSEEQLRATLQEERRILANEVHDALAQNIACMRMRTPLLRDAIAQHDVQRTDTYLSELDSSLAVAHARVRELITHFRSNMQPHGLLVALRETMAELQGLNGVELALGDEDMAEPSLTVDQSLQVLHIAREALVNVVKHSKARHGCLHLDQDKNFCRLSIEDDGIGIGEPYGENSRYGHFGLNIMRERAHLLGGELFIEPGNSGGTRIRLSFPHE
ncbi:MAG: ATP-binding protein, partial [Proteobacteria bacterium]|nr:ATP-binding protein [Pseudomonadota bacterium]